MYGLVNKAMRELVVKAHGEPVWRKICAEAGYADTEFNSMHQYPDALTYQLVGAASKVLDTPAETLLETFGEYWTDFAQSTDFGRLMKFAGRTLLEFVQNLDQMHAKIKFSLPDLTPPSFRCSDVSEKGFRLHYYSTRQGLAPLVIGMIKGVAKMHRTPITIRRDKGRDEGLDHDEFVVTYA
jgi:hypothetical protein